jgi:hypothetical protein
MKQALLVCFILVGVVYGSQRVVVAEDFTATG